jgi:hypothetical protein
MITHILVRCPLSSLEVTGKENYNVNRSRSPIDISSKDKQKDNGHTSGGWCCKIEWFDNCGSHWGMIQNIFWDGIHLRSHLLCPQETLPITIMMTLHRGIPCNTLWKHHWPKRGMTPLRTTPNAFSTPFPTSKN